MKTLRTFTILILLGGTLGLTPSAHAWICVRRPVYVTPYVAPVVVAPAPVYYAAPTYVAPAPVIIPPPNPIGSTTYSLPAGAQSANINGVQYYVSGSTYYRPQFGSNGVYYEVVANPI